MTYSFVAIIPARLSCQKQANFPAVEFLRSTSKFGKRKREIRLSVFVFCKSLRYYFFDALVVVTPMVA